MYNYSRVKTQKAMTPKLNRQTERKCAMEIYYNYYCVATSVAATVDVLAVATTITTVATVETAALQMQIRQTHC